MADAERGCQGPKALLRPPVGEQLLERGFYQGCRAGVVVVTAISKLTRWSRLPAR